MFSPTLHRYRATQLWLVVDKEQGGRVDLLSCSPPDMANIQAASGGLAADQALIN